MRSIAIVEDDLEARDTLKAHLARYEAERQEAFQITWFGNAMDFEETRQEFDLIFMDIQLPGINGMEAAHLLRTYDEQTPLIFVTNLAQYAVHGYEVGALDFIVKPVTYLSFRMRMDRAMRTIRRSGRRKITISTRDGVRILPLADVEYVEVDRHDLSYHLAGEDEPLVVYGSLRSFEQEVEGGPFVRISNSCLVNMNHIRSARGQTVTLDGGAVLYFSRSRKREALATIASFFGGSI